MSNYSPKVIPREKLDLFWSQLAPFLESGLLMSEGEMDISQLRLLCAQNLISLVAVVDMETDNIKGALALEVVSYPNFRAANIVSYGGYNLFASKEDFDIFKNELKRLGISKLQGWCKPAQARLFKSKYGFETSYEMIRVSLTEEN